MTRRGAWLSWLKPTAAIGAGVPVLSLCPPQPESPLLAEAAMLIGPQMPGVRVLVAGDGAPRAIDARHDRADRVGALALQVAAFAPVWQGRDTAALARAAVADGARCLLLAGALRGLRADRRLWLCGAHDAPPGDPVRGDALLHLSPLPRPGWPPGLPAFAATRHPVQMGMAWPGLRVLAFGADPALFGAVRDLGADVVAARQLDRPGPALQTRLTMEARALGAQLVTTEAEALFLPQSLRPQVLTLPMRLRPADPAALAAWVQSQG